MSVILFAKVNIIDVFLTWVCEMQSLGDVFIRWPTLAFTIIADTSSVIQIGILTLQFGKFPFGTIVFDNKIA